jgi:hypothetical protein
MYRGLECLQSYILILIYIRAKNSSHESHQATWSGKYPLNVVTGNPNFPVGEKDPRCSCFSTEMSGCGLGTLCRIS